MTRSRRSTILAEQLQFPLSLGRDLEDVDVLAHAQLEKVDPSRPTFVTPEGGDVQTLNGLRERERTFRQVILHHWECTVERVGSSSFVATLRSLKSGDDSEKEAELPIEEISDDDRELLSEGAIFYWVIGYETSPRGTRQRISQIKFRRLPAWTRRELAAAGEEANRLYDIFGMNVDAADAARG